MERQPSPRAQNLGVLLPLLALFLLMPPFVTLFTADGSVAGVPLIVVYLFGIWGLLLVATTNHPERLDPASVWRTASTWPVKTSTLSPSARRS